MTYQEKLSSPLWQKKRLEIFSRDNWTCTKCHNNHRTLHVHHIRYKKGSNPWEYDNSYLTTLCHICHEKEHEVIIDPERKYEHLIIYKESPLVINTLNIQLHQLQSKLKEDLETELMNDILGNIIFIQKQLKHLSQK